jgi:hypothetical protein
MLPPFRVILAPIILCLFVLGVGSTLPVIGQEKESPKGSENKTAKVSTGWTLDEAMAHLDLYPRDVYVQYVALQLAARENKLDAISPQIEQIIGLSARQQWGDRARQVDLFSLFSGALAVQESLQMDAMRGNGPPRREYRLRSPHLHNHPKRNPLLKSRVANQLLWLI